MRLWNWLGRRAGSKRQPARRSASLFVEPLEARTLLDAGSQGLSSLSSAILSFSASSAGLNALSSTAGAKSSSVHAAPARNVAPLVKADPPFTQLTQNDVLALLERAAAASSSTDAIIAVVDRNGRVLGVAVEPGLDPAIKNNVEKRVFAIDGALALARTAAFFANDTAPLTSRTIEFISQSTITQREVESDPNITNVNSTLRGPGFVAPIGVGGHFPPNVANTPPVDLFGIEDTNRDSLISVGPDRIKGTADDIDLRTLGLERFAIPLQFVPTDPTTGQKKLLFAPESYGFVSGVRPKAQARGIGTLPGGIPIYSNVGGLHLVGGIGVFFPGHTGYADEENSALGSNYNPSKPDRSLEAEWMAFAAVGGAPAEGAGVGALDGVALPSNLSPLPLVPGNDRIALAGVNLDIVGPHGLQQGLKTLFTVAQQVGTGSAANGGLGTLQKVTISGGKLLSGKPAPSGWLVTPHAGGNLTAADVTQIIQQGIAEANKVRAQIRLPIGQRTRMVFAVSDLQGNILGLFRMPDATIFSEDVAVAKARNEAYYDDPAQLRAVDQVQGLPKGVAMTSRTFRFLAQPRYPEGFDGTPPAPFSILNDGGSDPLTGLQVGPALPASAFQSVFGHAAFFPQTNFHDNRNILNQNGVVFFPGSSAVYKTINGVPTIVGGFGVSGDGVNQDDTITAFGINGFQPPASLMADQFFVRGVRLPYQVFSRNPEA
jgi:uncharacterized protein GlcG (DUF336 family)